MGLLSGPKMPTILLDSRDRNKGERKAFLVTYDGWVALVVAYSFREALELAHKGNYEGESLTDDDVEQVQVVMCDAVVIGPE